MIIECQFDLTESKNGRRYSEECVKNMIEKFNEPRTGGIHFGRFYTHHDVHEAGEPMKFDLSKASHKFVDLKVDGCKVDMTLDTINSPHGDLLITMIRDGGMVLTPLSIGKAVDGVVTEATMLGVMLTGDSAIPATSIVKE